MGSDNIRGLQSHPTYQFSSIRASRGAGAYNAVALRPIQATKPDSLVNIHVSMLADHSGGRAFSYPDFVHYRDHNSVFSGLMAASGTGLTLNDAPEASNIWARRSSSTASHSR